MVIKKVLAALRHRKSKIRTRLSTKVEKVLESVAKHKARAKILVHLSQLHLVMVEEDLARMVVANAEAVKRTIIITIMVTTKTIKDS